jgi:hypothetical protein
VYRYIYDDGYHAVREQYKELWLSEESGVYWDKHNHYFGYTGDGEATWRDVAHKNDYVSVYRFRLVANNVLKQHGDLPKNY